jgi:hypothetical protein
VRVSLKRNWTHYAIKIRAFQIFSTNGRIQCVNCGCREWDALFLELYWLPVYVCEFVHRFSFSPLAGGLSVARLLRLEHVLPVNKKKRAATTPSVRS